MRGPVVGVLIVLVGVVFTSALILLLLNQGVISLDGEEEVSVLNTDFIPVAQEARIESVDLCVHIDGDRCLLSSQDFTIGDDIFVVGRVSGLIDVQYQYIISAPGGLEIYTSEIQPGGSVIVEHLQSEMGDTEGRYTLVLEVITGQGTLRSSRSFNLAGEEEEYV